MPPAADLRRITAVIVHPLLRGLLLTVFIMGATLRLAVAQSGNYTSDGLVFPRQPPPQYVPVDLGPGYVVDMNDNGDVLVNDYVYGVTDTYTFWSGGNATTVPTWDDDGNQYEWQFVANDGEVLGLFYAADYSLGVARWNSTDGISLITEDDEPGYLVPDDADSWYWPADWNYTRDGSIYFAVEYGEQEVLATDYFGNPVGPDNDFYKKFQWSPNGANLTQVGDTIFEGGDADYETPTASITYPIVTAPGNNTLNQIFANTTYTDPYYSEIDYVNGVDEDMDYTYGAAYYYNTIVDTGAGIPEPHLKLDGVTVPDGTFFADYDTVDLTRMVAGLNFPVMLSNGIYNSFNGTVGFLNSGNFMATNLTANADSETALSLNQINSLGLGLLDSHPWLNGAELQWSNVLPSRDVNVDGTANFTALLPTANLSANTYYELTNLAENSTSVAGWVYDEDSGNSEAFLMVSPGFQGGGGLLVDENDNSNISLDQDDQVPATGAYSWWLNDDPVGGGNTTLRYETSTVNGSGDLVNFFPVFLNIQNLLAQFPPSGTTKYYLVQGDSAVNFVYTNLTQAEAFSYRTGNLSSGFGPYFDQAASSATKEQVTADGVELSGNFLANIVNYNEGVILLEGRTDSTAPLEVVVQQDDATVADVPLSLSLGPRILLLLHGMNSDTKTWNDFVHDEFGNATTGATNIFNGTLTGNTPPLTGNGVRCYRLQFGAYDNTSPIRTGLEGVTAANSGNYLSGNYECGDFETFDQLGQEVDAAVAAVVGSHWNTQIILTGHSRGGLAARDFLEITGNSTHIASVVGLLTTSTPHTGSPLAFIYNWLGTNTRGSSDPPSYTSTNNTQDWNCVDFLLSKTVFIFRPKPALDVRRPVIMDVACDSDALNALNDSDAVANLPTNIRYAEIINDDVELGMLTLSGPAYSVLDPSFDLVGYSMSSPAATYVLGGGTPSDFPGDGLVPSANQDFFLLSGFPSGVSISSCTDPYNIIHTAAPSQTTDLNTELNALEPNWFPLPPP